VDRFLLREWTGSATDLAPSRRSIDIPEPQVLHPNCRTLSRKKKKNIFLLHDVFLPSNTRQLQTGQGKLKFKSMIV
jgi:hypothetical protein